MSYWVCDACGGKVIDAPDEAKGVICVGGHRARPYAPSAEVAAFFAEPEWASALAQLRAARPHAQFFGYSDGLGVYEAGRWDWVGSAKSWGLLRGCALIGSDGVAQFQLALREGRALIDSGTDKAAAPHGAHGELATGSVPPLETKEPAALSRPVSTARVCACGQEIREPVGGWTYGYPFKFCGDCRAENKKAIVRESLDARIAETRKAEPDPTDAHGAWAWPSAEDEAW